MNSQEIIQQHKIYSEELQQWVVPLAWVEQALQLKTIQEVDSNMKRLEEAMQDINTAINKLNG